MTTRTDTDLLDFYGITAPPVGSVWTWHTPQGHRVSAVATMTPTDRLGRAGGIPGVDGRRLVEHPANVGILADIFRAHVCQTAYAMLVLDPDGETAARWTICDGNGRTTTPALTEFVAWRVALMDNADSPSDGPWVAGRSVSKDTADLRASLAAAREGRDNWKAEAERQAERANIAEAGLKGAAKTLRLDTDGDVEALGDAVVKAIRGELMVSRPAVKALGGIAALVGIRDHGDGSAAQAVDQIYRHLTAVAVALDHGPGADCTMLEAVEKLRKRAKDAAAGRDHFRSEFRRLDAVVGVIRGDLGLDPNDERADIAAAIEALNVDRGRLLTLLDLPWEADADTVRTHFERVRGILHGPAAEAVKAAERADVVPECKADVLEAHVVGLLDEHGIDVRGGSRAQVIEALGKTLAERASNGDELRSTTAALRIAEARIEHLSAWHRGPDPVAMASLWEHDPEQATTMLHPVFRLLPVVLAAECAGHKAAGFFPHVNDRRGVCMGDAINVGLEIGPDAVHTGNVIALVVVPKGMWPQADWIIAAVREGLALHPGVWALLGVGSRDEAYPRIVVVEPVPF